MSDFDFDSFFQQIADFEKKWREDREKELAKVCQENDFIVGSMELKKKLEEILPEGTSIIYSKFIDDPTKVLAVKKFDLSEYLSVDFGKENSL